jgi:hypothetical protein
VLLCALCHGTHACINACVRACVRVRARVRACVRATARTCGIYSSARDACAARAFDDSLAAGWRCRTASAPWAGRDGHTTVIDAAGAIYVIGGSNYDGRTFTYFNDVWKSTDGGVHWTRMCSGGTGWMGTQAVLGGLGCTRGLSSRGTRGVLEA